MSNLYVAICNVTYVDIIREDANFGVHPESETSREPDPVEINIQSYMLT